MKKNKKGFTLVELLAVIVILGVLLMIAVPAISNVIEKSRKSSFINSVKLVIDGVKNQVSIEELEGNPVSGCFVDLTEVELDRGSYDGTGFVIIDGTDSKTYTVYAQSDRGYTLSGVTSVDVTNITEDVNIPVISGDNVTVGSTTYNKCTQIN